VPALLALFVFAAAFALYARTAAFPFVLYDDPGYVSENPHLADGLTPESLRWAFTSVGYQYNWHPLTWLSHALDVERFGLDPGAHHRVNAVLHALAAALLVLALRALGFGTWTGALVAGSFALHPLRVESVAWIAERKDVLAGVFFALTLLAYARHARSPSAGRLALVALALGAGLMAKPTLVTVPFVLLLMDLWPLQRVDPRARGTTLRTCALEKLPLLALALAACTLTLVAQQRGGALQGAIPFSERVAHAGLGLLASARDVVWPRTLSVFYPHPALLEPQRSFLWPGLAAWLGLALALALAWRLRRRAPWIALGACWFLGMLVPMSGLVQVGTLARADRYAYLAGLGLELAAACTLAALARCGPRARVGAAALGVAWLAALAFGAQHQVSVWRDSRALFEHALAVDERAFAAHNNLGLVLASEGQLDEALAHFERAAELWPGFAEAQLNLGLARYRRNEHALACAAFERALALRPDNPEARLFFASALARRGDLAAAARELERALAAKPALAQDPRAAALRALLAPARPR
jgi:tetratricopeptide (TPR) repeat protein